MLRIFILEFFVHFMYELCLVYHAGSILANFKRFMQFFNLFIQFMLMRLLNCAGNGVLRIGILY